METQDHIKPNHSGNDGHVGVHVCHKCGWPYPNPHPSSKIRRAHKKVCGTIEKYRPDNHAQGKTHVEGYDGETHFDDELRTPSAGRTISRSNNGVGSRLEDEVFTDAVTEFSESPSVLAREVSVGFMQRFYSMKNDNDFEDTKLAENPIAGEDNLCTTDLLKKNQLRSVQIVAGKKDKMEAALASQDHISDNHSLVSAADQNIMQSSEDGSVFSLEDKQEESQKYVDEQKASGEPDHISDADSSNAVINIFKSEVVDELKSENLEDRKDSNTEEKKPIASVRSISVEGATIDAGETASYAVSIRSDIEDDGEYFTVMHNDDSKVSEDDLTVRNYACIRPTLEEISVEDLGNLHFSDSNGNENIALEGALLNGIEVSDEDAAEIVTIGDSNESDRINDRGSKLDKVLHSGDMVAGHSRGESLYTSQYVEEIESSDNDHRNSTSKKSVDENAEPSCQSSASVNHCSDEIFSDDTSCIIFIKQPATFSAIVDSGSVTDSLDGNWGSVSVISSTSDATPAADTIALNHRRALEGEESPSMVPKPVIENQHSQNQVLSIKPESEIHSSMKQQLMNSAIQSALTPTAAHVATVPNRGNKGKDIIANENTPLKMLLGEDTARSRAESPIHHNQNGGTPSTNEGLLAEDHPEMETVQAEMGKEWNSPARYPVNIKTEKRSKSRAYWVPFLCCSSVNAR